MENEITKNDKKNSIQVDTSFKFNSQKKRRM